MRNHPCIDRDSGLLNSRFPLPLDTPFDRQAALTAGVSDDQLGALLGHGLLRRVLQGVYAAAQAPDSIRARADALMLVLPPDTVVIERTAGWLHGMPVLQRGAHVIAPPLELGTTRDSRVRRTGIDGHRRLLRTEDVMEIHGIPVTTAVRTGCDLGRLLWRFDGLAALDATLRLGVDSERLLDEVNRFRGYRGVKQLRVLAVLADPRSESPGESALRLHWHDAGLPRPVPQCELAGDDGSIWFRLDLAAPDVHYATEYDGAQFHSSPTDRLHDESRRTWIREERFWVLDVFGADDVYRSRTIGDRLWAGFRQAREALARWTP